MSTNSRLGLLLGSSLALLFTGCTGSVSIVSVSTSGAPGDGPSYYAAISANGNHVAFVSEASNFVDAGLLPSDGRAGRNVYVRDGALA